MKENQIQKNDKKINENENKREKTKREDKVEKDLISDEPKEYEVDFPSLDENNIMKYSEDKIDNNKVANNDNKKKRENMK